MISSVNVDTNLFWGIELKDHVCYRYSHQMYNWRRPHNMSHFNVWGIGLWQHTIFTEVLDRNLLSITSSRSVMFFKTHLRENKIKRTLIRLSSIFSFFLVWATRGTTWEEADTYTASTPYCLRDIIYHSLDTYQNWQFLIEKRISRYLWLKT